MKEQGTPRALRTAALALTVLFIFIGLRATWIIYSRRLPVDFLSYWAASRLVLSGRAAAAYDVRLHHVVETLAAPIHGLLPFGYPPPSLFVIAPLGLTVYWAAFAVWLCVTAALYFIIVGAKRQAHLAFAHPAVVANFLVGQNGFLTTSIFAGGMRLLPARPFLAGVVFGLMIIKPQLAVVIPFAMIAGREWKVILGGVLSASCTSLAALVMFGRSSYESFMGSLPLFTRGLAGSLWRWNELASPFALLRFAGLPEVPALIAQTMVAMVAIALTCRAWWRARDNKAPMLAAATLLVSPYLFTYDALLLVIPTLWLLGRGRFWSAGLCWFLCLLPVATYFGLYPGPNTVPIAAMLCLGALFSCEGEIPTARIDPPIGVRGKARHLEALG